MIIPIRCFTCGEITGDKWEPFIKLCHQYKNSDDTEMSHKVDIQTIDLDKKIEKSVEGKVLDDLGLKKMCCRRMILTNVPLISYIN